MERTRHKYRLIIPVILGLFTLILHTKDLHSNAYVTFQNMLYRAYVESRMSLWESTLASMEAEYKRHPDEGLLYDILLAQYGLTGYYLGIDEKRKGRDQLEKADTYLEIMEGNPSYIAEAKLFRAAFNAFRIGLRPWLGVRLGPQSERLINDAISLKKNYPRGWIEKGNLMYYAPPVFGGSKTKAIEHYKQAILLMENNMQNNHRWLYLSTLVSLAQAYENTGDQEKALKTLNKALEFEPGFAWVNEELLPKIKSKR